MKAYIESMGCDSNLADANKIKEYLKANNVEIISDYRAADFIFFMSCGFNDIILTENLKRLNELKKTGAKIILGGCIPKIKEEVVKGIDFSFGPKEIDKLDSIFNYEFKTERFHPIFKRNNKKIIRIATGCEGNCSYCVIRKANGRTKSRSLKDIGEDIKNGLKEGFNKFIFTSEDTGSWGQDIDKNITDLIKEVNKIEGNFKVSLTTFNPQWFLKYPELFDLFKTDKIDKKIYLPLQSGSDRILKLMNRKYTVEEYLNIFNKLNKTIPGIKIQTDILVGFPTETEDDFNNTFELVKRLDIYFLQVFAYTDMEYASSNKLEPKISFELAEKRAKKIILYFLDKHKSEKRNLVHTNLNDFNH